MRSRGRRKGGPKAAPPSPTPDAKAQKNFIRADRKEPAEQVAAMQAALVKLASGKTRSGSLPANDAPRTPK